MARKSDNDPGAKAIWKGFTNSTTMKNIIFIFLLAFCKICIASGEKNPGQMVTANPIEKKCTSTPCANTATGEAPFEISSREGAAIRDTLKKSNNDKQRWGQITLYSDSKKSADLTMPIIKSSGFTLTLDPQLGRVIFSKSEKKHIFEISTARGDKKSLCPEYNIKIADASESHVILNKFCLPFPYKKNRSYVSNEYFLYDLETGSMRTIWLAATQEVDSPTPEALPIPSVKKIKNGYRYDWIGLFPSDNTPSKMEIHNIYLRKKNSEGKILLNCIDTTAKMGKGSENEMCEGAMFEPIILK